MRGNLSIKEFHVTYDLVELSLLKVIREVYHKVGPDNVARIF